MMVTRVVFDSNVYISALATPSGICGKLFSHFQDGLFEVITSAYIFDETERILIGKFGMDRIFVHAQLQSFASTMIIVDPIVIPIETIDENDWPIIGTALAGDVQAVVTGDQKILRRKQFGFVRVASPRAFLNELEEKFSTPIFLRT